MESTPPSTPRLAAQGGETTRLDLWLIACIALVVLGCHAKTLGYAFLDWDDPVFVTRNAAVLDPSKLWGRGLLTRDVGYPIPLTIASYAAETALLGLVPWHFHLLNVLLHVASCVGCFVLARRMGITPAGASLGALLFGLHPVVAEPVSWVTGRKDVLACTLGLTALSVGWSAGRARRALSVACYALAILAKLTVAPLALLIPLVQPWFATRGEARVHTFVIRTLPYLAVLLPVVVTGVLGLAALGGLDAEAAQGTSLARASWYALGHHLRLLLGLEEPTAKYLPSPWPPGFVASVDALPVLTLLAAGALLACMPHKPRRAASFGLVWAALTYLPNSNLLPLVRFLADSYVYLPLVGAAWFLAATADALAHWVARISPRPALALRVGLPLAFVLRVVPPLAASQARFHDDLALWQHARGRYPHNAHVCRQWANAVAKLRGGEPGLEATDSCIAAFGPRLFVRNRAVLLEGLGRAQEARAWLEQPR